MTFPCSIDSTVSTSREIRMKEGPKLVRLAPSPTMLRTFHALLFTPGSVGVVLLCSCAQTLPLYFSPH